MRYDLGLTTEEFWEATPGELAHIERRYANRRRDQWLPIAQLCSLVANATPGRSSRTYRAKDFLPDDLKHG